MTSEPYKFTDLPFRDRGRVMKAIRAGTAVEDSSLAPYAVRRAQRWQVVPKRGSLAWFAGFAEVGRLGLLPVLLVLFLVSNRWGLPFGLLAAVLALVPLAPVSRREGAVRRKRAHEAEIANTKLLGESSPQ